MYEYTIIIPATRQETVKAKASSKFFFKTL
jgi:hypothetical protein